MSKKDHPASSDAHGQATARAKLDQEATPGKTIHVFTEQQLHNAVDDPNNAGASIFLETGTLQTRTYVLKRRLLLKEDMKLYGVAGDRSAIKIDTRSLDTQALTENSLRVSSIAVGLGTNAVEWLTIIGNPLAAGGIGTDLPGIDPTTIRVAHVISHEPPLASTSSQVISDNESYVRDSRGIDIRNLTTGRIVNVEIEECEFFGQRQGIRITNFPGVEGAEIHAEMRKNYSHGNRAGCFIVNNGARKSRVEVGSNLDNFEGNAAGCVVYGGFGNSNENFTRFEAKDSRFVSNRRTEMDVELGGVVAAGGRVPNNQSVASRNHVVLRLENCTIEDNQNPNFAAYGARNTAASNPSVAGTYNTVSIELYGGNELTDVKEILSDPSETSRTNKVEVQRGQIVPA